MDMIAIDRVEEYRAVDMSDVPLAQVFDCATRALMTPLVRWVGREEKRLKRKLTNEEIDSKLKSLAVKHEIAVREYEAMRPVMSELADWEEQEEICLGRDLTEDECNNKRIEIMAKHGIVRDVLEIEEKAAIDRDLSVATERVGNLKAAVARIDGEVAQLDREAADASKLKAQIEKRVVEREALLRESTERAAGAGAELSAFDTRLSEKRREADEMGRHLIVLINNIRRNEQGIEIESRREIESRQEHAMQLEIARDVIRDMEDERAELANRFQIAEQEVINTTKSMHNDRHYIEELAEFIKQIGQQKQTLTEDQERCRSVISDLEYDMAQLTAARQA